MTSRKFDSKRLNKLSLILLKTLTIASLIVFAFSTYIYIFKTPEMFENAVTKCNNKFIDQSYSQIHVDCFNNARNIDNEYLTLMTYSLLLGTVPIVTFKILEILYKYLFPEKNIEKGSKSKNNNKYE